MCVLIRTLGDGPCSGVCGRRVSAGSRGAAGYSLSLLPRSTALNEVGLLRVPAASDRLNVVHARLTLLHSSSPHTVSGFSIYVDYIKKANP